MAPLAALAGPVYPSIIDQTYATSLLSPGANLIVVATTIQAAVDAAAPGDVVFVPSGTYNENVTVSTPGLTIVGPHNAVLNGAGLSGSNGITVQPVSPSTSLIGFSLIGLNVENYSRNGIFLRGVNNYQITSGQYTGNGSYGIFPVRSTNGVVANNTVSGSSDAGIYVGQSVGALIRDNTTSANTVGIEIENTLNSTVTNNTSSNNSIGFIAVVLPGLSVKETTGVTVTGNTFENNNQPNPVTDPTQPLSILPGGVGALFAGANQALVTGNLITGNGSIGLGLFSQIPELAAMDPAIDPIPDFDVFTGNNVTGNGLTPDPKLELLGFPPADIVWDGTGTDNGFADNAFGTSVPDPLPLPTPEPATGAILGGALIALRATRRRRAFLG